MGVTQTIVLLLALSSTRGNDSLQEDSIDPTSPVTPLDGEGYSIASLLKGSNGTTILNCTEVNQSHSLHRSLICPDVESLHDFMRQEKTKDGIPKVEVEIQRVDGPLTLHDLTAMALVSLIVKNTNLTSVTLNSTQKQKFWFLEILDLSGNPEFNISSLSTDGLLPKLTRLSLRGSALSSLGSNLAELLRHLPKLKHLDIASTGIHELRDDIFTDMKTLEYLDVSGTNLGEIKFSEDQLNHLKYLNVSGCGLRSLKVMEAESEGSNSTSMLSVLDVSRNHLSHIPSLLLSALHSKVVLNLTDNHWNCNKCSLYYLWHYIKNQPDNAGDGPSIHGKEVIANCFNINETLRSCSWEDCPQGCQCFRRTKTVDCSGLGLQEIPFFGPSSTEVLNIENNRISSLSGIDSPAWCNLKVLRANHNLIDMLLPTETKGRCSCRGEYERDIKMCFPQGLSELSLRNNSIYNFSAFDCPLLHPVKTLNVSTNKLNSPGIPVCGHLQNLEVLDASNNSITCISESSFASLYHIKKVNLSHNKVRKLELDAAIIAKDLKVLDLSYNHLEDISSPHNSNSFKNWELSLSNNRLSQMKNVVNLPELKKVTLYGNPWACNCTEIEQLMNNLEVTENTALYGARSSMSCETPNDGKMKLTDFNKKFCKIPAPTKEDESGEKTSIFMTLMAIMLILFIFVLICHSKLWKKICSPMRRIPNSNKVKKKYDCFVVSSSTDLELVRRLMIIPLTKRGYSIAWHENAFSPGRYIMENIERAVRNSSRMLVFATDNFVRSRWGRQEIRRGRHEEINNPDYKVMSLVSETLPRELNRDLYELVVLRTHVKLSDRDYIQQICNFLPHPSPVDDKPDGMYMTENDIQALLKKLEEISSLRRRENMPLAELFHTSHEQNRVTINVDISTASSSRTCDGNFMSAAATEQRAEMMQRFKTIDTDPQLTSADSTSLNYYVIDKDNDEDISDLLNDQVLERSATRKSCKF